ncbi:MAG: type III pantothenate kinase [Acidobacteriota bacterium]
MGLLAVDIGNSNMVVGLFQGEQLVHSWRLASRRENTADEIEALLGLLLGSQRAEVSHSVLASVVPALTAPTSEAIARLTGSPPLEVAPGIKTGLKIRTDNPAEVGADRIVNAVAALSLFGGPAIVVDLGTATTLDVVTAAGEYLGGLICPGPQLGADALSTRAARLPRVELSVPGGVVGHNTVDAMRAGVMFGHAAMVDGLVSKIQEELGIKAKIILTGGLASTVAPLLDHYDVIAPQLTLDGLRLVWDRSRSR